MNETQLTTLAQLEAFVVGTAAVVFQAKAGEDERYRHISGVLRRFRYATRSGVRRRGSCCATWRTPRAIPGSSSPGW